MIIRVFLLLLMCLAGAAVHAQQPLKLVYFNDFAPFSWQGQKKMQGIYVDILHEALSNRMGLNVTHQGYPWARAQSLVKGGKADGFITVATEQRRVYTQVSEKVTQQHISLFVRASHTNIDKMKKIKSIAQLKGYTLVDYVGNGWGANAFKDLDVHWLARFDQIFPYMMKDRGDAHVASSSMAHYNLKKMELKGKIIELPNPMGVIYTHLCLSKKSSYVGVLDEFNKVVKGMKKDGSFDAIFEKYK